MKKKNKSIAGLVLTMQVFSLLMIAGGVVRIFAGQATFAAFGIEHLWITGNYNLYIYRTLGGFVIFAGLLIFALSRNITACSSLLPAASAGFALITIVMLGAGWHYAIALLYLAPDIAFSAVLAFLLMKLYRRLSA